uniref:Uncharacterized protein n=1 Tax=Anguilla anguilla TaxID=7936 RepID=A0A0E9X5K5_ANGAN
MPGFQLLDSLNTHHCGYGKARSTIQSRTLTGITLKFRNLVSNCNCTQYFGGIFLILTQPNNLQKFQQFLFKQLGIVHFSLKEMH